MNMIDYIKLEPGVYNLYKSFKIFGFEISKPYVGSITVNEDGSYMTTSATKYHSRLSDYPALYFYLDKNGDFIHKYFMKHFSFRFFIISDKKEIEKYINELMYFLKDVKYIVKYTGK